jgi:hypothetical protein
MLQQRFTGSKRAAVLVLGLWLGFAAPSMRAQQQPPPLPPPGQTLTPDQLDDLVAPIALYPDELLSQIMVAATYPLEVVEAFQWMQRNPGLNGPALTEAAQQQNWDPSVQALVVFPDVMKRLNDDVTWTTNLGNAFLAQQNDVMDAVQRMRQRAQQAGRLQSTPQLNVETTNEGGQPYIDIEPADPDVMYVPVYDPVWIWGPPLWYPYPRWYWPPRSFLTGGLYFGFGGGINVGLFFGGGWRGWGGWGWHPGWGERRVIVNNTFIHQNNFNARNIGNAHGTSVWSHNPEHRGGVPYANPGLRDQYRGNVRQNIAPRSIPEGARNAPGQTQERFGNRSIPNNPPARQQNRGAFGGMENGAAANTHAEHGMSSLGPARSAPQPRAAPPPQRSAPAPRAAPAPRSAPAPRAAPSGGGRRR